MTEGNPCERHLPTVQVACNGDGGRSKLFGLEVVTTLECHAHFGENRDAAVDTEGLGDVFLVSCRAVVGRRRGVTDRIVESQVPR